MNVHNMFDLQSIIELEPAVLLLGDRFDISRDADICNLGWNCVFTTQCNVALETIFSSERRKPKMVLYLSELKTSKWNKSEMPIVWLNGHPEVADFRRPMQIKAEALSMLDLIGLRLKEFGRIVCLGIDPNSAILNASTISKIAYQIGRKNVVVLLSADASLFAHSEIADLIDGEHTLAISKTTQELLSDDQNTDFASTVVDNEPNIGDVTIFSNKERISFSNSEEKEILFYLSRFASLMDYVSVEKTISVPHELTHRYFASFIKNSTGKNPLWYGYTNGFHFQRTFEEQLYEKTISILENAHTKTRGDKPILLHGQACSGKSSALAALAVRISKERIYPVIYIGDPSVNFYSDTDDSSEYFDNSVLTYLESTVRMIEERGNVSSKESSTMPVLIIWDSSSYSRDSRSKPHKVLRYLQSKGRKVQLVCSSYEVDEHDAPDFQLLPASIQIDDAELSRLKEWALRYYGIPKQDLATLLRRYGADENFLAFLYTMWDLRTEVGSSVHNEISLSSKDVVSKIDTATNRQQHDHELSPVHLALKKAYTAMGKDFAAFLVQRSDTKKDNAQEKFNDALLNIALCTWLGQSMPYTLMLRQIGGWGSENTAILKVFAKAKFLLFISNEDNNWDATVSTRTELEAKLILEQSGIIISTSEGKRELLRRVISLLNDVSDGNAQEVFMMRNIIRLIGPNNKEFTQKCFWATNYSDFKPLIDALTQLRENGVDAFALQEITLRREFLNKEKDYSEESRLSACKEIIAVADDFIGKLRRDANLISSNYKMNRTLALALVERANLNNRLYSMSGSDSSFGAIFFDEAYNSLEEVLAAFPFEGYAYSAIVNAGLNQLNRSDWRNSKNIEATTMLIGKICSVIDLFRADKTKFSLDSQRELESLDSQIGQILDALQGNEEYFSRSVERGEPYGIFLKARSIINSLKADPVGEIVFSQPLIKKKHRKVCEEVISLFNMYPDIVNKDPACLNMAIRVKWLFYNKYPLYTETECRPTRLSESQWQDIQKLCEYYLAHSKYANLTTYYLLSLCCAQLGDFRTAKQHIAKMREFYDYEKRSMHLICDFDGKPIEYRGRYKERYDTRRKRGYMSVFNLSDTLVDDNVIYRAENIHERVGAIQQHGTVNQIQLSLSFSGFQAHRYNKSYSEIEGGEKR